jgi:hypothetical protein
MIDPQIVDAMIGTPYDKVSHNCWHYVRDVQLRLYSRDLPDIGVDAADRRAVMAAFAADHPERQNWQEVPQPEDGAIVMMAKRDRTAHAGVYVALDEGLILHCDEPHGVAAERPLELQARCWGNLRYFVPVV